MKCPFCGEADSKVIDSRPAEDGSAIRRRRQCNICKKRFTTYEKVETIPLIVIKKDRAVMMLQIPFVGNRNFQLCAQRRAINLTGANPVCLRSSQPTVASLE